MTIIQHQDESHSPAEKCLFPVRNDGYLPGDTATKPWGVTNLCSCALKQAGIFHSSPCSPCCLDSVPSSKKRDPLFYIATIWALLLWEYAEIETAHVGIQEISFSTDERGLKKHMKLLTASKTQNTTLYQLINGKGWSLSKGTPDHFPYFNTGIVLYHSSKRPDTPESDCLAAENDEETCDVMLAVDTAQSEWYLMYKTAVVSSGQAGHLASFLVEAVRTMMKLEDSDRTASPLQLSVIVPTQQGLIRKWNRAEPVQLSAVTIHQIIHNVATADPGHPALVASDGELTYGQLDNLSSRLARHLQAEGVRPGMLIPVCFSKSLWAVIAMLAINKAGAAFVTLDASQPPSRLRSIIKQLDNPLLALASPDNQALLGEMITPTLAVADGILWHLPMETANHNTNDWPVEATAPAYCFFTSGSTGEPKGCLVDHAALASVATHCHALHLDSTSRVLQFASFSFGVSLIEIWCALSAGGTVCMPSDSDRVSRLGEAIQTMGINWAFVTPTVLATLEPDMVPGLRRILVAGEALKKTQISIWASRTSLYQAYGFTEWAGICCVSPQIHSIADIGIIGSPANARCWLIKPGEPEILAPIGAVGEILVEGPSLAQRYLHSPEKSAASFLPAPTWRKQGILATLDGKDNGQDDSRRWYRTGDLAFYDSNGLLRYVSRKDRQVKVRGQRIDLGEPEYYVAKASSLFRQTVIDAIVPADGDGVASLMAFVLASSPVGSSTNGAFGNGEAFFMEPNEDFVASVHQVIEYLEQRLPDVMIPRIFLLIRSMPLTVTGKIDRLRLRREAQSLRHEALLRLTGTARPSGIARPPETTHEYLIHKLVVDVLRLNGDQVGMEHDFFALGGDSVKAMKFVSRARKAGIELTVKHVFGSPNLSELARIAAELEQIPSVELFQLEPFALVDAYSKPILIAAAKEQCRVEEDRIEDIYPCTPLQEGMMALSASKPGAYIARFVHRLQPHVNPARLRHSWEAVVQACPILRTRIVSSPDGGIFQVVLRENFQWDEYGDSAGATKELYMKKRQTEPLMLGDRLVHAALLPGLTSDSHTGSDSSVYFIITMHHSVCDRWASRLLMDLLEKAHDGQELAHSPITPFMHYMQQRLTDSCTPEFWEKQFQGLGAEVFPALPSPGYAPIPRDSCQRSIIYQKDAPSGYTISNVLRLAWALVISHHTSLPDVVFSVTVSGRAAPVANIEQMIAPIVATVPLRVQINPADTVLDALAAVQKQSTEMIPFEQFGLQRIRKLSSEAADACSYQSQLVVQPVWADEQRPLLTTLEAGAAVAGGFASCALSVVCSLTASRQVDVALEFDSLVISPAAADRILRNFEQVVQVLLADPQGSLANVPLLSAADVTQLRQWSGKLTRVDPQCVHSIIKQRCVEYSTSTAIWAWDGKLSYTELDQLSDGLAAELATSYGVGPEVIVPICMERSRWTTVAILGVIKAGGAFTLLDPSQPQPRLENICRRVNAMIVLTSQENVKAAQLLATTALVVDEQNSHSWPSDPTVPIVPAKPNSMLYVAFTSGSTGTPKGVVIEHQSFCASALALNHTTQVTRHSRLLQFAGYSFDGSIMETLSALMAGACLCVPSDFQRRNELASATKEFCLTHAHLTPSLARHVLRDTPDFTKVLVSVGETLTPLDVADWASSNPQCRVMNGYGPAECAVSTTIQPLITTESSPQNIGFPLAGVSCWVVHPEDHEILLPIGAVGELLVEGPTVARGYLNDHNQSASAFISSPPSWMRMIRPHGPHGRVYRTGDLVRYNSDGSLQYVGRRDSQVKLRGQRIELGEVEKHVRQCWPGLSNVAVEMVTFTTPSASTKNLIGFVVANVSNETSSPSVHLSGELLLTTPPPSFQAEAAAVHSRLCDCLPRFMVPEVFLPVRALPQSAAGKLDRRRLRDLAQTCPGELLALYRNDVITQNRAPSSDSERALQAVWSHVLNHPVEEIGVDDNFYHLGGDSITAMQIVAQARAKGLAVSLDEIMRHKTISQIVRNIASSNPVLHHQGQEEELDVEFPLSPIQQMFMDHQAQRGGWNRFNQTFLLRLAQPISLEQLRQATSTVLARHSMLRARFARSADGHWTQRITSLPGVHDQNDHCPCIAHDVYSHTHMNKITVATSQTINIERGPLAAINLFNVLEDASQHLFLVVHHLVVDLVSWRIILADFESILKGEALPKINDSISFQAWSRIQSHHAEQMLTPKAALPIDLPPTYHKDPRAFWFASPDQPNRIMDTQLRTFTLTEKATRLLLGAANHTFDTQPVEVLHATLLHSFLQAFPNRAVPVSFSESHGREVWNPTINLAQTVGWFTVAWPVIVPQLEQFARDNLSETVRRVKDARRAVPSKGWAYFASRYLHPEGRKAFETHHPMELIFNYAGEFQQLEHADALFIAESHEAQGALEAGDDIQRFGVFEVFASVQRGRLQFQFMYPREVQHQDMIDSWIAIYQQTLEDAGSHLIAASQSSDHISHTLDDFPLMSSLTYPQLKELLQSTLPSLGISMDNVEDIYPCSPSQRGMLIAQAKQANNYNASVTWQIQSRGNATSGKLSFQRLYDACCQVIQRHAALRTVFVDSASPESYMDQVVLRHVRPEAVIKQSVISASDQLPAGKSGGWPKGQLMHQSHICRVKHDTDEQILLRLDMSHTIMDRTTMQIIERDICLAYDGKLPAGRGPAYSEYVAYINRQDHEAATRYWQQYLEGVEPCEFPSIRPEARGPGMKGEWGHVSCTLKDSALGGSSVDRFCREHNVTIWNLAGLAWALVLRSFTNSDNVCFGYVKSGRDLPIDGIADAVGAILNPLTCRIAFDQNATVEETIHRLQDEYLQSLQHQTFSLSDVHRLAGITSGALFNTSVGVQTGQIVSDGDGVLKFNPLAMEDGAEDDLVVGITPNSDHLVLNLRYKKTVLSDFQALSVIATFEKAIRSIITTSGDTPVTAVDIFSEHDHNLIWTRNQVVPPLVEACVHDIIHQRCLEYPDSEAVCDTEGSLSYRELDELSTRLARYLTNGCGGIAANEVVPICLEKSRRTLVAMLGVLKAGGTLLLLETSYPQQRRKEICDAVHARIVVTSPTHVAESRELAPTVVLLGTDDLAWAQRTQQSEEVSLPKVEPHHSLYVVFTSGSTGKPKGLVVGHGSYCSDARDHIAAWQLTRHSRVTQFSSYAFDMSILEQLSVLMAGACVCVVTDEQRKNNFGEVALALKANFAMLVPSVARLFGPEDLPTINTLMLAGECMTETDVSTWAPHVTLINGYGPAECSALSVVQSSISPTSDPRNVGYAIGCVLWVVDPHDHNRLVPHGATGELLIEGPIVGKGYINQPEKTAQAFINPPSWLRALRPEQETAGHLYMTGDLVRSNPDGSLTVIGRKDRQIKLRGQRLELAEVEVQVLRCFGGAARDAVAEMIAPAGTTKSQLVALVLHPEDQISDEENCSALSTDTFPAPSEEFASQVAAAEVRLRQAVPEFMVPAIFLPLREMPRTHSGKVDRNRLRNLVASMDLDQLQGYRAVSSASAQASNSDPPSTPAERTVADIWAQVLDLPVDTISANDNFFLRGGHSIDAMKAAALGRAAGLSFTVADIFAYPVLADLAREAVPKLVNGNSRSSKSSALSRPFSLASADNGQSLHAEMCAQGRIPRNSTLEDFLPVTQAQFFFIQRKTYHSYNWTIKGGSVNMGRLRAACQDLLDRYSILRTSFVQYEGHPMQMVLGNVDAEIREYHCADGQEPLDFCRVQWESIELPQLDVMEGSLPVKFSLISAPQQVVLTIQISHAQWDGVSIPKLFADFAALYNQTALPPTSDFSQYVYHRAAPSEEAKEQDPAFQFWREYLKDATMATPFPPLTICDEQSHQTLWTFKGISPPQSLPPGVTMATLVKSASAFFLAHHLRARDVVFGHTVNGRNLPMDNIESLLGCCLNFIPLRITFPESFAEWTVLDLMNHAQHQYIRALPHEHVELCDIFQQSTSWTAETPLNFIVQHQNIDLSYRLPLRGSASNGVSKADAHIQDGDELLDVRFSRLAVFDPLEEVWVFTEPHPNRLEVQVCANSRVLPQAQATALSNGICSIIEQFAADPSMRLADVTF